MSEKHNKTKRNDGGNEQWILCMYLIWMQLFGWWSHSTPTIWDHWQRIEHNTRANNKTPFAAACYVVVVNCFEHCCYSSPEKYHVIKYFIFIRYQNIVLTVCCLWWKQLSPNIQNNLQLLFSYFLSICTLWTM